jgi:hypothetical protein
MEGVFEMKNNKVPTSWEWCPNCDREIKVKKIINKCKCGEELIACNQCTMVKGCAGCEHGSNFTQRPLTKRRLCGILGA